MYAGASPKYHELDEQDETMARQPLPTGHVVPDTVYQMPYQIPQIYQQVNGVTSEVEVVRSILFTGANYLQQF